ncbi:MAG TPA: hypothetical protein ACQGQH_07090 [Xylella sp.]
MEEEDYVSDKVELVNIYLDNENPRHDPIAEEKEIIATLVAAEKIEALTKSIMEHGTSPLERIAVIRHPTIEGKYIVVEGNRRLCSLMLLRNPERAPNTQSQKVFEQLKDQLQKVPEKIDVVVFKNREAAGYWLSLRHEGEQGGVDTRQWDPSGKARFNKFNKKASPTSNPNKQALALFDYTKHNKIISPEERNEISISTVTRYLSNPVVRSTLGLKNKEDLTINVTPSSFEIVVKQFLDDALSGKVHSRSNSEERKEYGQSLVSSGAAPTERTSKHSLGNPNPTTAKKVVNRNSRHPDKRAKIVPRSYTLKYKDPTLRRIFEELRTINLEKFNFAANYLFRAFVKKLIFTYAKQNGIETKGKAMHCVRHSVVLPAYSKYRDR